jgi:aspartate/methionine/tyrosine aminotransferase
MTIGEPRHAPPDFLMARLAEKQAEFGRYPPINGIPELREAIADWLIRRYGLDGAIDADRHVHPLSGSREGLFSAVFPAIDRREAVDRPAILMPNPFYQVYLAAALSTGAEPVLLPAMAEHGFLPDLDALERDTALLARTRALYLCSPANPQGTVASAAYLARVVALAQRYDFMLFADECYSEVYAETPPVGALEVAWRATGSLANVVAFNSLSKRSNLPGLRSGFVAGDPAFIARFSQFRNVAGPQMPIPVQWASAAIWRDETHVEASRAIYRAKFDLAACHLGNRFGKVRPDGGFFLWLDVTHFGGGEKTAVTLWKSTGVRVLPGAYLTRVEAGRPDPGSGYIRIALVHDLEATETALVRVAQVLE